MNYKDMRAKYIYDIGTAIGQSISLVTVMYNDLDGDLIVVLKELDYFLEKEYPFPAPGGHIIWELGVHNIDDITYIKKIGKMKNHPEYNL